MSIKENLCKNGWVDHKKTVTSLAQFHNGKEKPWSDKFFCHKNFICIPFFIFCVQFSTYERTT